MRDRILAAVDVRPGMVVTAPGTDDNGTTLTIPRQIASRIRNPLYSSTTLIFTDGTRARVGASRQMRVARTKTGRRAATHPGPRLPLLAAYMLAAA